MGRTIPTYRQRLNAEIAHWKSFRNKLPERDKKDFDDMLIQSYQYADAGSCVFVKEPFYIMLMSILGSHMKRIDAITKDIEELTRNDQGLNF